MQKFNELDLTALPKSNKSEYTQKILLFYSSIAISLVLFLLGTGYKFPNPEDNTTILVLSACTFMFALAVFFNLAKSKFIKYEQLAADNNLDYEQEIDYHNKPGSIFKLTEKHVLGNHIVGDYKHGAFALYNTKVQRAGKTISSATIIELELKQTYPQLVIDSILESKGRESVLPIHFAKSQMMSLEGDFDNYFDVYGVKNYQIETLMILVPELLQELMRADVFCDIEIIEDRLYFYFPGLINDIDTMKAVLTTVDNLYSRLERELFTKKILSSSNMLGIDEPKLKVGGKMYDSYLMPIVALSVLLIMYFSNLILRNNDQSFALLFILAAIFLGSILTFILKFKHYLNFKKYPYRNKHYTSDSSSIS